ncbi:MAG: hypothetical protein QX189_17815, partial [Methylococcales bacterium]
MKTPRYFLFSALLAITGCATDSTVEQTATPQHNEHSQHGEKAPVCAKPSSQCSNTVAAEFAPDGV